MRGLGIGLVVALALVLAASSAYGARDDESEVKWKVTLLPCPLLDGSDSEMKGEMEFEAPAPGANGTLEVEVEEADAYRDQELLLVVEDTVVGSIRIGFDGKATTRLFDFIWFVPSDAQWADSRGEEPVLVSNRRDC